MLIVIVTVGMENKMPQTMESLLAMALARNSRNPGTSFSYP
nr:hypothetical protein [Butyrivibrio sp. NC3005]